MNGLSLAEFELPSHQRKAIPKTCIANDTITDEALALFGGLASAASATWQAIGSGPYQRFTFALPFRSPKHPELTRPNQQSWLVAMLNIFSRYRAEILTAEALLTYATAFDMRAPGRA